MSAKISARERGSHHHMVNSCQDLLCPAECSAAESIAYYFGSIIRAGTGTTEGLSLLSAIEQCFVDRFYEIAHHHMAHTLYGQGPGTDPGHISALSYVTYWYVKGIDKVEMYRTGLSYAKRTRDNVIGRVARAVPHPHLDMESYESAMSQNLPSIESLYATAEEYYTAHPTRTDDCEQCIRRALGRRDAPAGALGTKELIRRSRAGSKKGK